MTQLTVGHVSGIIAIAVFLVQLLIPTILALIIVGVIGDKQSAVSWSVVSRLIHSSYWPVLLRSDSAGGKGVSKRVDLLSWLQPGLLTIVTVAAIVTPLGLLEEVSLEDKPEPVTFHYVPDASPFGKGTPPRSPYESLRFCRWGQAGYGCPGSNLNVTKPVNSPDLLSIWPASIDMFESGSISPTISSVFDIDWRSYYVMPKGDIELNPLWHRSSPFVTGFYRQLEKLIVRESIIPVEGLLVDTKVGSIGFRNHTVPVDAHFGAVWSEDILFVEPVTRCVNMNLTLDSLMNNGMFDRERVNISLVDRGGFSKLSQIEPETPAGDFQKDPDLVQRAYAGAWEHNLLLMQLLNITGIKKDAFSYLKSKAGVAFPLHEMVRAAAPDSIEIMDYGQYLDIDAPEFDPDYNGSSNPFRFHPYDFENIKKERCRIPDFQDPASISNIAVSCGMVLGAAKRIDGGDPAFPGVGSEWSRPLYSCASTTKATIREVKFNFNGTAGLDSLRVIGMHDKPYANKTSMPLWGVERLDNHTLASTAPLWGIVSAEVGARGDISTVQREHLWLPAAGSTGYGANNEFPIMAGNQFHMASLQSMYSIKPSEFDGRWSPLNLFNSGQGEFALYRRWETLSADPSSAETILNLIWTDLSANAVTGKRSWLSPSKHGDSPRETVDVPVILGATRVKYRLPFAIPAIVTLSTTLAVAGYCIFLLVSGRTGLALMGRYLAQTSAGRILCAFLYPDQGDPLVKTKHWVKEVGRKKVQVVAGKKKKAENGDDNHDDDGEGGSENGGGNKQIYKRVVSGVEETTQEEDPQSISRRPSSATTIVSPPAEPAYPWGEHPNGTMFWI